MEAGVEVLRCFSCSAWVHNAKLHASVTYCASTFRRQACAFVICANHRSDRDGTLRPLLETRTQYASENSATTRLPVTHTL